MNEFFFFCLVGLVAVFAAIVMLWSDNAVHSALSLIVVMACIAFLFLLLNAPFLAMIQITVYTGAIMVLFLFVIMLLGSERLQDSDPSSDRRGVLRRVLFVSGLVASLLIIVGIVLGNVHLDLQTDTGAPPQVRVLNVAPDAGTVDVYANDQLVASALPFRTTSSYVSLPPGDYVIKVQPQTGAPATMNVSLKRGTQQTVIDYGSSGALSVSVVADDNSTVTQDRSARVTFFNASAGSDTVNLVDLGTSLDVNSAQVILKGLTPGQLSDPVVEPEGTVNWAVVDATNPTNVLYRLVDYTLSRDTSGLVVYTQEQVYDATKGGTLRPLALPVVTDAAPSYGGPRAIGLELFTNYMLVFQLLALLLLTAMIGAIVLTHRQTRSMTRKVGVRRRVSRPLVSVIASQVGHEVTSEAENVPELQEPTANAPAGD